VRREKVAQHTLFNRGAFGDLQLKGRCAYASNRDGAAGGDAALTSGIIVFDMKQPSIMKVVPASGDTVVVGTAPSEDVLQTSTNKWGEQTTAAVPVNPNGKILRTPAALEAYSGLELAGNIMVAGYKDNKMVDVYDVSDCLNPVVLNAELSGPRRPPRRLAHARLQDLVRRPVRHRGQGRWPEARHGRQLPLGQGLGQLHRSTRTASTCTSPAWTTRRTRRRC
jgi:hypothetical protein